MCYMDLDYTKGATSAPLPADNICMTTALDTLKKCLQLEGFELFSADECDPYLSKSEPDQIDTTINEMAGHVDDAGPDSIDDWFLELNSYSQSYNDYDFVPEAISRLHTSLLTQKASLANTKDDPLASRFEHIVDVAIASTHLISNVRRDDVEPKSVLASFNQLQQIVHADGKVDDDESLVIDVLDNYMSYFFTLGGTGELLNLAKTDVTLTESKKEPVLTTDSAAFYMNGGPFDYPTSIDPDNIPASYSVVPKGDKRLKGKITDMQCFSFALSKELASSSDPVADELGTNYRAVDLRKKKARVGDVILYTTPMDSDHAALEEGNYVPLGEFHHLAIVSEVDKKGFPTMVMSKLGEIKPIYEHPVDEAPLSYGVMWTVYRKK